MIKNKTVYLQHFNSSLPCWCSCTSTCISVEPTQTQTGHRCCSSQSLSRRYMTVRPRSLGCSFPWRLLPAHQIRLQQACCGMEIYQKWQTMTDDFQRLPPKWRMISSGLDWQGDRRWNSRAAVLRRIRNDMFWNIEGVLGCRDWTSLSQAALHGADGPCQWERGEVMTASV